jgi:hypothetical protein
VATPLGTLFFNRIATMKTIVECKVDQNGVPIGFESDVKIQGFGIGLEGQHVTLTDGRTGIVVKVYSHIQTRQGESNWCAVDVETAE